MVARGNSKDGVQAEKRYLRAHHLFIHSFPGQKRYGNKCIQDKPPWRLYKKIPEWGLGGMLPAACQIWHKNQGHSQGTGVQLLSGMKS